jgi:inner membrane transporter RhtA
MNNTTFAPSGIAAAADRVPPHAWFIVSAVFHYLGPSFAVMLFTRIEPLGVAWLRIASAAVVFAIWRRPWRYFRALTPPERRTVIVLGVVLAGMNALFYLAIDALPLATVGAIEFLGPIGLAALGVRSARNLVALAAAVIGAGILTDVRIAGTPLGYVFAFANCALFVVCCSPPSESAFRRRSSPMSPINWPWRGCRAPRLPFCYRSCRQPPPRSASSS